MCKPNAFRYFKKSPEIIRLAMMNYVRFPLSLRNVEDLMHELRIDVSHETVQFWWKQFGPMFAAENKKSRIEGMRWRHWRGHLDQVLVKIEGTTRYLSRAVDHEGEVLEAVVNKRRDQTVAFSLLKRNNQPETIVTEKLRSYGAAHTDVCLANRHEMDGRWINDQANNSHLPLRRRERCSGFGACEIAEVCRLHGSVYHHFNLERCLYSRSNFKENHSVVLIESRHTLTAQTRRNSQIGDGIAFDRQHPLDQRVGGS